PNENVVVFHSGHGSMERNRPEATHVMTLNTGALRRADIRQALDRKQPRAIIFLTDCCSSYRPAAAYRAVAYRPAPRPALNTQTIRNLVLRPSGRVSITAAEDGTQASSRSVGTNPTGARSAFPVAMLKVFTERRSYATWREFFPRLRQMTHDTSGGQHRARAFEIRE